MPALDAYLHRFGRRGRPGTAPLRALLRQLDPIHPANSLLEVHTRRLLVAHGLHDFVREFPLSWNGRTFRFDFAFVAPRVLLETNGRRWHDDAADFERDQAKWSVPARHGYRLMFATWQTITRDPGAFVVELRAALGR
jgi:very-short-patch-repair endonuclease